ncbi:MAG: hypothetical protein PHV02_07305 [Rhodocyclaceae bacterium]|nr:hypothetical protein [Rhodocyclaceae bacterium]
MIMKNWVIDPEACTVSHQSGLTVRFDLSDLIPNAVVGEIVAYPDDDIDMPSLLAEAGTLYAASRACRH